MKHLFVTEAFHAGKPFFSLRKAPGILSVPAVYME
jgi:hypothetical protein